MRLISQWRKKSPEIHWGKDIIAGVVVSLVSIPIAMGYAQIAGLPVIYGLYGSLLPILIYAFLTTSPQFVVGVDAMPAVMVGSLLAEFGIAAESELALQLVPMISFLTAVWFVIFYLLKAGRVVKYISTPVMSGFISGVGLTIILMQIPKLFGGSPGTGEVFILLEHIAEELKNFNFPSAVLGIGTVAVILICKKQLPGVPMTVVMMGVGAILQVVFHLDQYGVKVLPEVAGGLPRLVLPDFRVLTMHTRSLIMQSLSIAAVIMAQTLLATGNYAMKYGDKVDNNAELLAYSGMNLAGGLVGCCPVSGSVSRSGIADSMGCHSQVMSLSAAGTMLLVLLFGTPLLKYLPVPILTGIVMTALIGILDRKMAKKLWKTSRNEFLIFMTAFLGVLIFGTVYGVVIGVLLSFMEVAIRAVTPPSSFLGRIDGVGNYYALNRNSSARPIRDTLIYRFSGNLFFANIDKFQADIEGAIRKNTRQVIVDARGIGSIDITAAERLRILHQSLEKRGIRFYLTEHDGSLNDQLRVLGAEELLEKGAVRRTITLALRDAGIEKPFVLEEQEGKQREKENAGETVRSLNLEKAELLPETEWQLRSEFEWLFGKDAEEKMSRMAEKAAERLTTAGVLDTSGKTEEELLDGDGLHTSWGLLGLFDEDEFLDHVEIRLETLVQEGKMKPEDAHRLEKLLERRRHFDEEKLKHLSPKALEFLAAHRRQIHEHLSSKYPEEYEQLRRYWKQ